MGNIVFLTGGTGFIGGELCAELLRDGYVVWALVRAADQHMAMRRLLSRIKNVDRRLCANLHAVCGDIRKPALGIDKRVRYQLIDRCDHVIHTAGETRFNKSDSEYDVNPVGVTNLLEEVSTWPSKPEILHMSTASVCTHPCNTVLLENNALQGYANSYVLSKRNTEQLIRSYNLDVICVRPSIVVSRNLPLRRFAREILWFFPVASKLGVLPIREDTWVDIVPVDYVVRAIIELVRKHHKEHNCYHISAGLGASVTCGECIDVAAQFYGKSVTCIAGEEWQKRRNAGEKSEFMKLLDVYLPFVNAGNVYSNERISKELGEAMPICAKLTEFLCDNLSLISREEAMCEARRP
ncbi:MAG: SDR family oxidoreductase [Sedimentisphaerales bacterium]|nr:SDR family oxidoreductase [Sedimentisphaerales bacterium]